MRSRTLSGDDGTFGGAARSQFDLDSLLATRACAVDERVANDTDLTCPGRARGQKGQRRCEGQCAADAAILRARLDPALGLAERAKIETSVKAEAPARGRLPA